MPQPISLTRLALLSCAAWVCTLLLYFAGMVVTAVSLQRVQTSTAEVAVVILIVAELFTACASVAFIFLRSRGLFRAAMRFIWVAVFALLQLGTSVVAAFVTLLALNR